MDVVFNVSCHFRIDHTLFQARKSFTKAHELCQGLGLGNIGFWSFILQAFLQARACKPGRGRWDPVLEVERAHFLSRLSRARAFKFSRRTGLNL